MHIQDGDDLQNLGPVALLSDARLTTSTGQPL